MPHAALGFVMDCTCASVVDAVTRPLCPSERSELLNRTAAQNVAQDIPGKPGCCHGCVRAAAIMPHHEDEASLLRMRPNFLTSISVISTPYDTHPSWLEALCSPFRGSLPRIRKSKAPRSWDLPTYFEMSQVIWLCRC